MSDKVRAKCAVQIYRDMGHRINSQFEWWGNMDWHRSWTLWPSIVNPRILWIYSVFKKSRLKEVTVEWWKHDKNEWSTHLVHTYCHGNITAPNSSSMHDMGGAVTWSRGGHQGGKCGNSFGQ